MHYKNVANALLSATLLLLGISGCSDQKTELTSPQTGDESVIVPPALQEEMAELSRIAGASDYGVSHWLSKTSSHVAVLSAGSVDGLAAAIAAAGRGGVVLVKSGMHQENGTVTITDGVTIVGEHGATLKSAVEHSNEAPIVIRPAIYVHGAKNVVIWNIDFRPIGAVGGTAILVEDSPKALIGANSFADFQFSILLNNSSSSTIWKNDVRVTVGWQTGDPGDSEGIVNVNGDRLNIIGNDVSDGLLGIFASGGNGNLLGNNMHDNFVGFIACKVPAGSFELPSGNVIGSLQSGHHWLVEGNRSSGNFQAGYLVIDGANHCRLVNNEGHGNLLYDIELCGETFLFGFCTPTCYDNKVIAGRYGSLIINDFGLNNTVIGGTLLHDAEAPCPSSLSRPSATNTPLMHRFR